MPGHVLVMLVTVGLCIANLVTDGVPRGISHTLAILLPAGAVLATLLVRRVRPALPWWLALGALVVLGANQVAFLVQVDVQGGPTPSGPLVALALPVGYLFLLGAVTTILLPFIRRDGGRLVEAAILALVGAGLVWVTVARPALEDADAPTGELVYSLALFLVLAAIAGMVARCAVAQPAARPAMVYLTVAVLATFLGNVGRVLTIEGPVDAIGAWALLWLLGYGALAAALVHPSSEHLGVPGASRDGTLSTARLTLLGFVLLLNPLLASAQEAFGDGADWMLLLSGTLLLVPLVVVRIAYLARLQASAQVALTHLVSHDELTGLISRRALLVFLDEAIARLSRPDARGLTVLFLDVDGLKATNDRYGHRAGDQLLQTVAGRLAGAIGVDDVAARVGGDEFVVVCEGSPDATRDVVARVRQVVGEPVRLAGVELAAGASIGIVELGPGDAVGVDEVVALADSRMYEDKRHRYGRAHVDRRRRDGPEVTPSPTTGPVPDRSGTAADG
ncbi:GGDEF domain-containing protein [Cellulomonas fimi]|uniref:Diguanylate cyclase n=1 Tax=Cellulomonas fimi TaxID=1708 RepID=A0A7Y0LX26_CELFI|nr:GGDEF domain-containing protein [Cellulomonas fimi]NMR18958.1 diguanylate cyclase [Cellulomonas fimi]